MTMEKDPCIERFRLSPEEMISRLGLRVDLDHEWVSVSRRFNPTGRARDNGYPELREEFIVTVYKRN